MSIAFGGAIKDENGEGLEKALAAMVEVSAKTMLASPQSLDQMPSDELRTADDEDVHLLLLCALQEILSHILI